MFDKTLPQQSEPASGQNHIQPQSKKDSGVFEDLSLLTHRILRKYNLVPQEVD